MKRLIPVVLVAVAAVLAIVVIGGGGNDTTSATAASGGTTIKTRMSSIGTFLVDGQGRTLYLFEADKPNVSNCSGACLGLWPPLAAKGKPTVSGGVSAAKLGIAKAPDGTMLVTYNRHPLYYYAGDQKPGDTTGQALNQFGAKWYVVTPAGSKIDND
jgi:predicted lipoprotein with Yx(FWY)xxD motif